MWVRLLGPVEVWPQDRPVSAGPRQRRAVLAALAVDAGRVVTVSTLVDRVWGEAAPEGARSALYAHVTRLRGLGVPVARRSGGYLLDMDPEMIDVHRIHGLFARAREPGRPTAGRAELLSEAVALWRGEPLLGLPGPWAERMRSHWGRQRVDLVVAWAEVQLAASGPAALIGPLGELVAEQPLCETLVAAYMRVLCAAGRSADALACFASTRAQLAEDRGADPGPQLRELHRAILRGEVEPTAPGPPHQLRAPVADFVGRGATLDVAVEALRAKGIVAIQGMGGVGKTELALLAASRVGADFPDAQVLVNMRGITPTQALRQVIQALRPETELLEDQDALQRRYCAVLAGRRVLVLADDAEGAAQVRPLLPAPGNALLVTSRQRFTLPGMAVIDLEPLPESDAVVLLQTICHRVPEGDARRIARACGALPLALRVSGSLLSNDPAVAVADHAAALADRRQRLASLRDPDDPQLDVAASLELSYSTLDDAGRSVLCLLSVLEGDFTTELAQRVADRDDAVPALHLLLRRNLIGYDPTRGRWRLHDLIRDLAGGHLGTGAAWEAAMWRYARAAVGLAQETSVAERAHVDAARRWALSHAGTPEADRILVAEATATFGAAGFLHYDRRREIQPAVEAATAAARRLGDAPGEAALLNRLGLVSMDLGHTAEAIVHFEQQLTLARGMADPLGQARALNNLGLAHVRAGEAGCAVPLHERQLALARDAADPRGEAMALCNLADAHLALGRAHQALAMLEPALAIARGLGDHYGQCRIVHGIGLAHLHAGAPQRAEAALGQALAIARTLRDRHSESKLLADLARALLAQDRAAEAATHAEQALHHAHAIGVEPAETHASSILAEISMP